MTCPACLHGTPCGGMASAGGILLRGRRVRDGWLSPVGSRVKVWGQPRPVTLGRCLYNPGKGPPSLPLGRRGAVSLSTVVLAAALPRGLLSCDFHDVEYQPGQGLALSAPPLPPTGNGGHDGEGGCGVPAGSGQGCCGTSWGPVWARGHLPFGLRRCCGRTL